MMDEKAKPLSENDQIILQQLIENLAQNQANNMESSGKFFKTHIFL
jgi:hypothetical protein